MHTQKVFLSSGYIPCRRCTIWSSRIYFVATKHVNVHGSDELSHWLYCCAGDHIVNTERCLASEWLCRTDMTSLTITTVLNCSWPADNGFKLWFRYRFISWFSRNRCIWSIFVSHHTCRCMIVVVQLLSTIEGCDRTGDPSVCWLDLIRRRLLRRPALVHSPPALDSPVSLVVTASAHTRLAA